MTWIVVQSSTTWKFVSTAPSAVTMMPLPVESTRSDAPRESTRPRAAGGRRRRRTSSPATLASLERSGRVHRSGDLHLVAGAGGLRLGPPRELTAEQEAHKTTKTPERSLASWSWPTGYTKAPDRIHAGAGAFGDFPLLRLLARGRKLRHGAFAHDARGRLRRGVLLPHGAEDVVPIVDDLAVEPDEDVVGLLIPILSASEPSHTESITTPSPLSLSCLSRTAGTSEGTTPSIGPASMSRSAAIGGGGATADASLIPLTAEEVLPAASALTVNV